MKYVYLGKIVNTHGIKGELRILSDFKYKDKVLKKDFSLYIGKDKTKEVIATYRPHKQFDMVTFYGYDNINQVLKYKGLHAFINKEDLILDNEEYLNEDLIGLDVIQDNLTIGKIKRIENYGGKELIRVENSEKSYLIPYTFDIINNINLEKKQMIIKNIKGLIE